MTSRPHASGAQRRGLALVAAAALVGAPLLAGSPAAAQATDTVTFTANCGLLGLGGRSAVDPPELTVESGAQVEFVNEFRHQATLTVGEQNEVLPAGESVTLTFPDGPTTATITLRTQCLLENPSSEVTVTVVAPATPSPEPSSGAGDQSSGGTADPAPSPSAVGGAYGEANAPAGSDRPGGWTADEAVEEDDPQPLPGSGPADGAMSQRPQASESVTEEPAEVEPAPGDSPTIGTDLTPTAASGSDDSSVGLLALIATVCVVGVSAGAIRVLLGQRSAHNPA